MKGKLLIIQLEFDMFETLAVSAGRQVPAQIRILTEQ